MSEIVCSNCGANFDEKEAKCPFCGYISYPGAEDKFMKDMEEIRDNLSDLASVPKQEYKKEMLFGPELVTIISFIGCRNRCKQIVDLLNECHTISKNKKND